MVRGDEGEGELQVVAGELVDRMYEVTNGLDRPAWERKKNTGDQKKSWQEAQEMHPAKKPRVLEDLGIERAVDDFIRFQIRGDSLQCTNWIPGRWRCKDNDAVLQSIGPDCRNVCQKPCGG